MAGVMRQLIDVESLERFIHQHVPEISTPIEVTQFGFGQSNPTYLLTCPAGDKFVLRKKPPGNLLSKTAHRVEREYRVIHALEATDVPVPKTFCLCRDVSVIGTPFYIMEFIDGRIIEQPWFPGVSPDERKEMWRSAVQTLAKLHRINPASVGLSSFGRDSGFYNRQLATFGPLSIAQSKAVDVASHVAVGPIPHFEDLVDFFGNRNAQPGDRATLVHGDYKIDNLVFHKTEPRVIGILDWELSTIGHPLSDLANLTMPYITLFAKGSPEDRALRPGMVGLTPPDADIVGLPTRQELLEWYRAVAGWDARADIPWGDAFGIFRGAIICQGIAARQAIRQASSVRAGEYAKLVGPYGNYAWELTKRVEKEKQKQSKL